MAQAPIAARASCNGRFRAEKVEFATPAGASRQWRSGAPPRSFAENRLAERVGKDKIQMSLRAHADVTPESPSSGAIASTANWRYRATEMTPGLIVVVVRPSSGVCSANSTGTHPWEKRPPFLSPPEYNVVSRLYSNANPHWRIFGLNVVVTEVAPVGDVVVAVGRHRDRQLGGHRERPQPSHRRR